jgi:hypothetical protein
MPRKSPEALAGAWFRATREHGPDGRPIAPECLNAEAKRTFTAIVNSRAPDLFGPGSLELLAHFCQMDAIARVLWAEHAKLPIDDPKAMRIGRMVRNLVTLMCRLAECSALLPRHTHGRRSGVLSETYDPKNVLPWQKQV